MERLRDRSVERGGAGRGEEGWPRSGGGLGVACVGNVSPGIPLVTSLSAYH